LMAQHKHQQQPNSKPILEKTKVSINKTFLFLMAWKIKLDFPPQKNSLPITLLIVKFSTWGHYYKTFYVCNF
jgi:hypothetical protein